MDRSEDQDQDDAQAPGVEGDDAVQQPSRGWAGWVISGAFHALMLLIMMSIYWVVRKADTEYPPVATQMPQIAKKQIAERAQLPPSDVVVDLKIENPVDAPITQVEVEDLESSSEDEHPSTKPKGDPNELSDSEMSGQGFNMAIGAGGGDAGATGIPTGSGVRRLLRRSGAPTGAERTVNAALRWFKRHQSPSTAAGIR